MRASSRILLRKESVTNNWKFLNNYFNGKKISAVVKGNAYGHDIQQYVPLVQQCGVDHFAVFNAHEAYIVYKAIGRKADIMIMGHLDDDDLRWAIENGIEFYVFDRERILKSQAIAWELNRKAKLHIEVETGMFRTGIALNELEDILQLFLDFPEELKLQGLCTHLAGAENLSNFLRIQPQKKIFLRAIEMVKTKGLKPEYVHACCSAAALRFPDMHFDMLRIGIMQYGFWPNTETFVEYASKFDVVKSPLERVISWETTVMSIKEVPENNHVGYGRSFYTQEAIRTAVIPIGYAYGFTRDLSNTGMVLIRGKRAPVIGTINMNCLSVNISNIPDAAVGDKVTLIGHNGDQEISVSSFSELSSQLNYEMLSRLPEHIPRSVN